MKYIDQEIKYSIVAFLGESSCQYFHDLMDEHGTCWVREAVGDMSSTNWTTEGGKIKDHVIENFPDIVEEIGDYEDFEDYIYTIVEEIFR